MSRFLHSHNLPVTYNFSVKCTLIAILDLKQAPLVVLANAWSSNFSIAFLDCNYQFIFRFYIVKTRKDCLSVWSTQTLLNFEVEPMYKGFLYHALERQTVSSIVANSWMHGCIPVSYTHLDVYKRQESHSCKNMNQTSLYRLSVLWQNTCNW